MKQILLFGAGKSATCLIEYLIKHSVENEWQLVVCDSDRELALSKTKNAVNSSVVSVNVEDDHKRKGLIDAADMVISMLPPALHFLIAKDCLAGGKHLLTASYVDDNIRALEKEISDKNILFLCEMGLDPGIDHMSAMKMIHAIKNKGGKITRFVSHCGGLVAPESDNNPWHYKITWNPRNIVMAGKDGAEYLENDKTVKVPYNAVFRNCPEVNIIDGYPLCWYPNRDSLHYINTYGLEGISTFIRTTLRHPAFTRGWNKFVNIGLTDTNDLDQIKDCKTYENWWDRKTARFTENRKDWNNYLHVYITDPHRNEFHRQLLFLGIESNDMLPDGYTCSADILQYIIEKKLAIGSHDKDMIVMLHEMDYDVADEIHHLKSSLVVKGEDSLKTAMAKTVGLPLGIAAKLILQGKIRSRGLHIPVVEDIYEPVLFELEKHGIGFEERVG
jgi:saccharopine dehydrogenase (NADP+, L-glutamate forming)